MQPNDYEETSGGVLVPGGLTEKRREMKSRQKKQTRFGDVYFTLAVDIPRNMPEDDFKALMYEYGVILSKAFNKRN